MRLESAIIAVLNVFGKCKESDLFNLLSIGHELGLFDAGVIKWGVDCFYSRDMYEALASLIATGKVKQNGYRTFETHEVTNNEELVDFYKKIRGLNMSTYKIAWYVKAKKLSPSKEPNKLSKEEKEEINKVINLNILRATQKTSL